MRGALAPLTAGLFWLAAGVTALAGGLNPAPYAAPPGLQDVGSAATTPFVLVCSGQSNAVGQDDLGSKVVQANVLTTNDVSSPTTIIPAAFGMAPFNGAIGGGTTTNPVLSYNNQCVHFANYLRLSGVLPASRPIIVVPNFFSSQSINQWIGNGSATIAGTVLTLSDTINLTATSGNLSGSPITVTYTLGAGETTTTIATGLAAAVNANATLAAAGISATSTANVVNPTYPTTLGVTWSQSVGGSGNETDTLSFVAPPHWTHLTAQLAVVTAAYPGATVNHVIWDQGENDSSGSAYSSQAAYLVGFRALLAQLRSLAQWAPTATVSATEMGTWFDNSSGDLRNDALRILANGFIDPYTTTVTSSCPTGFVTPSCESAENVGPHFNGWALMLLGQRHFQAWLAGRINGGYHNGLATYYGAALAFPNPLSFPSTGGTLTPDDIRTGATVATAGGTIALPKASIATGPVLFEQGNNTVAITATGSNVLGPNSRNSVGTYTAPVFSSIMAVPVVSTNTWRMFSIGQNRQGDSGRYAGAATLTGVQTLDVSQMNGAALHFNGATVTLTNNFGVDLLASDDTGASTFTVAAGTFSLPDGTTPTSLTLQPGQTAWMFARITSVSTLTTQVVFLVPPLYTTGSIGGGALSAGACTSGTVAVPAAITSNAVVATPSSYPGDGAYWDAYVSAAGTVTVKVCATIGVTPAATTYNVRLIP